MLTVITSVNWTSRQLQVGLSGFLNGESIWSKAEKQSAIDLSEYINTGDATYLQGYEKGYYLLEIDRGAREGIFDGSMPEKEIRDRLAIGTSLREAASGVEFMIRYGRLLPYVSDAIAAWKQTDPQVARMRELANIAKEEWTQGTMTAEKKAAMHSEVLSLNADIEPKTRLFSQQIAEGASVLSRALLITSVLTSVITAGIWFLAAIRILKRIRGTEDRLRLLFEAAPDAIVVVDKSTGTMLDANETAARWSGVDLSHMKGKTFESLFAKEENEADSNEPGQIRMLKGANQSLMPVEIQSSIVQVADESVGIELLRDVSQRLDFERERRVAAVMGHELRTPLNAIFLAARLLRGSNDLATRNSLLDAMMSNSQLLLRRLNDTIDMVSINKGQFPLRPAVFNISELLRSLSDVVIPQAATKDQNFDVNVQGDADAYLYGDRFRIEQALINIISNSIKFSPERATIGLTIELQSADDQNVEVRFAIIDNGKGIPPQARKLIFEPYYQAQKKSKGLGYDGLGLGLFIVKSISDQMRGTLAITANDDPKKGTVFHWSLPLRKARPEELGLELQGVGATGVDHAIPTATLRLQVLVADDTPPSRKLLSQVLTRAGHTVFEAADGGAAFETILTTPLDVVLLDMNMPVMSGEEVLDSIRSIGGDRQLPAFVAVSADSAINRAAAATERGVLAYFPKPIGPDQLLDLLQSIAQKRPQSQAEEFGQSVSSMPRPSVYAIEVVRQMGDNDAFEEFCNDAETALLNDHYSVLHACEKNDKNSIRQALHALKNSFLVMGCQQSADWAQNIYADPKQSGGYEQWKDALEDHIDSARVLIATERESIRAARAGNVST